MTIEDSMHNDGGPAFPAFDPYAIHKDAHVMGMSLRDWFAGQALAGYLAYPHAEHPNAANRDTAAYCYEMADDMLEARK